jgi:hypothetical protein
LITDIPFDPDYDHFSEKFHLDKVPGMQDEVRDLIGEAQKTLQPKAVYKVCYVDDTDEDSVTIEGITFKSKVLRGNLEDIGRVFCYIVTCGDELEDYEFEQDDFYSTYLLDELKEMSLRTGLRYLRTLIKEKYNIEKLASMSPGSGDMSVWPIEEQKKLFSLFPDVTSQIGVELKPSFLMTPNKTISGVFFPTKIDFETCQVCRRENCPNRRAPFKGEQSIYEHF